MVEFGATGRDSRGLRSEVVCPGLLELVALAGVYGLKSRHLLPVLILLGHVC